jgi:hypothetical protein
MRTLSCLLLTTLLTACVGDPSDDDGLPDGPATAEDAESKADTAEGERKVRAGQLTLTVNTGTTLTEVDGQRALVIRASTSRRLESVFSWVPDDAFGEARLVDDTHFELILRDGHELNSILSGLPLFVQIRTATGTIRDYTGRVDLAPRFARFSGSSKVFLDAAIEPIYFVDPIDPLRYRARVTTTADASSFSTTAPGGVEVLNDGPRAGHADFTYQQLAASLENQLGFTASFLGGTTGTKRAEIDLRVVKIGLTTDDPYDVWAPPTCTDETLTCLRDLDDPAWDWSECGSYRETQVCVFHKCEIIEPEPLSLEPIDAGGLDAAAEAFRDGCPSGGSWCHLDTVEAFALPECRISPIGYVVDEYLESTQDGPFEGGVAPAEQSVLLNGSYSPAGPALYESIRAWAGSWDGPVEAWVGVEEVPCHNCTDFIDRAILYFPERGRVVVVTGGHGYDS